MTTENVSDLIFEELKKVDSEDRYVLGFRMKKKRNWKYRYVSAFLITNRQHEFYGQWVILAYQRENQYFSSKKSAMKNVAILLEEIKQEFVTGKRNWWTGRRNKKP